MVWSSMLRMRMLVFLDVDLGFRVPELYRCVRVVQ